MKHIPCTLPLSAFRQAPEVSEVEGCDGVAAPSLPLYDCGECFSGCYGRCDKAVQREKRETALQCERLAGLS